MRCAVLRVVEALERIYPTTIHDIRPGRSRYVLLLNERGHLIDDGMVCREATLEIPESDWMQGANGRGGKQGVHTEHFGHLLAELQYLQRAYPGAQW